MAVRIPATGTHVFIEWEDSEGRKGDDEPIWISARKAIEDSESGSQSTELCLSSGWILSKTRTRIVLVSDVAPNSYEAEVSRDVYIPKSAIRSVSIESPPTLVVKRSGAVVRSSGKPKKADCPSVP